MSQRKIFIVEEDLRFADKLKAFLKERPQWEVTWFATGEDAIQSAHRDPHVVIIDYHLDQLKGQGLNGIDTMKEIRKIAPEAHCWFLSGQKHYGVALQTISEGAEGYIIKDENALVEIGKILDELVEM